ncbi:hypothetical protein WAX74_02160 [Psychrobacillus sp. FJAT-51614]|uniref:Uncharacterized protein n=1 Tax=Psychrobacillus mangrovi TaxID=3117745 RepID=A0ABU8F0D0_9BACI
MMHKDITPFIDYGVPVAAEEERSAAFCINSARDARFVIAAKGFVIVINLENGNSKQIFFPEKNFEYPFSSFSSNGLFYIGAGKMFMVLDPFEESFIYYEVIENGEEIIGFSFADDMEGNIYFTTYPHCHLLCYKPISKDIIDYGSMDPSEKYAGSLAIDQTGWAYIGIGTENKNLVAFHLETGFKKNLVPDSQRQKGTGYVYLGEDSKVYGHMEATDLRDVNYSTSWMTFSNGDFQHLDFKEISPSFFYGTGFKKIHRYQEADYQVISYSLAEGIIEIVKKKTGISKTISFKYTSDGAVLSTICIGPDGHLYGTSMHPLHFFRFNFITTKSTNFGGRVIEKGGGGNICAYASNSNLLIGVAYAGGKLYVFDTTKSLSNKENPKLVIEEEKIHRPRCAITLRDQKHMIWGGFPGYGMVGGGLGIYHIESEKNLVLAHEKVVAYHSTVSLAELTTGDILGGTSIETPGGAQSKEKEGCLYILDWKSKMVRKRFVPLEGAKEISMVFVDQFDRAHCLTDQSIYFVCNPYNQKILYRKDLSRWGETVRNGFVYDMTTNSLFCLLSKTLLKIEINKEKCIEPEVVRPLPSKASSGVVLNNDRIFYGSGSHLCSIYTGEDEYLKEVMED